MRVPRHAEVWTVAAIAGLAAFGWVLVRGGAAEAGRAGVGRPAQIERPPSDPDELEAWLVRNPSQARSWLELGNHRHELGRAEEAHRAWLKAEALYEAMAEQDFAGSRSPARAWYNFACVRSRLGKADAAVDALGRAVELGWNGADHALADPDLEALRPDERFIALTERMRSPDRPRVVTDP